MKRKFDIYDYWLFVLVVHLFWALAIFGAGCKTKYKEKTKLNEKLEIEQVHTYTVTTIIDTTIKVPGAVVSASEPLTEIVSGDTLRAEENGISIEIYYNQATKKLHAKAETKPKTIPIQATKTQATTESNKLKSNTKEVKSKTEVKSDISGNIKLGILLLIVCLLAGLFIYWRIKGLPLIS